MAQIYKDGQWYGGNSGGSDLPSGGTQGQVLTKKSSTDGDVDWETPSASGHIIKNNSTSVADESALNFTDFDISDDSTNSETDIKVHRLTQLEMADICSPLPGAPYRQIEYSTTEQVIGKWIDGRPVYQKTIVTGSLPNNTNKYIDHGIENIDIFVSCQGVAKKSSDGSMINLPNVTSGTSNIASQTALILSLTQIRLQTGVNRTDFDESYVTLQYIKTTD